ncbi:antiviral reverse transcriptase Drt3b [Geothrix sp. PMB-07]|uniref:antiviral reverse transcriptase Drt3b n=1 Tax=Geothrix sp. PMB-07 TaxID=3068640 RepID=UPI002740AE15|nr:antiviral reverse transcriptase Drt3b [Geothrix sp. PMB-07]WLT30296.1 antiviral reverse transcriptase Drt3b [Geothrix sp. PMB-07]
MSRRGNKRKIKRSDYTRVILTETLPFETPVIFSNDGLYGQINDLNSASLLRQNLLKALIFGEGEGDRSRPTVPHIFKIKKNSTEFRRLALVHPRSQWIIKEFYQKYETLMLYHCAHSPASIRSPEKIASAFFMRSDMENLHQYKTGHVGLQKIDEITKHVPSFFSYRGFDRLYKFFESRDYFLLEKKYSFFQSLDVSKCFDSIYTHVMSWSVKDKEFTKKHVTVESTFAQEFDWVMRHCNHNETNGIVIGPEISRIFSEIIFQKIDLLTIKKIKEKKGMIYGEHYEFRRYVDDVYIFSNKQLDCKIVYDVYSDVLTEFNLRSNSSKSILLSRPFITNKSRLIHEIGIEVDDFIDKFLESSEDGKYLIPKRINSVWKLTQKHIEVIKSTCSYNDINYDGVSGYLIGVFEQRIKKIVSISKFDNSDHSQMIYRDAIFVLLDIMFFLYQISPSVSASYKICTSIILLIRFSRKFLPEYKDNIAQRIYELSGDLLSRSKNDEIDHVEGFLPLEVLNIILGIRELGPGFLLPCDILEKVFINQKSISYFDAISCLFYIRNDAEYKTLKDKVIFAINEKLMNLKDIRVNAEKAYLLLDMLGCPYVSRRKKTIWLNRACKALDVVIPGPSVEALFFDEEDKWHAHIDWAEVDLLNVLEKKLLKQVY